MIECRKLCSCYHDREAVKDVSLSFLPSQVTVIIGPNGCGKSTLLRTILGLKEKQTGEILYDGVSISALSPREIARQAAYLPQSRSIPQMKAERMVLHGRFPYLSYPRVYRKEDYAVVAESLKRIGAETLGSRMMAELSGGQRQKIYIAMALAQDTETILMDEPTTYLDAAHQMEVMQIAGQLAAEGKSVVMVLHDLCLALRYADRLVVMQEGAVAGVGTPEELYASGLIPQVFGVNVGQVRTEQGLRYYYEM